MYIYVICFIRFCFLEDDPSKLTTEQYKLKLSGIKYDQSKDTAELYRIELCM